ncbi:MAG: AAA family ATPase [Anaerolineae bacterium]|nr:AAA family ATPase [Anaerolineae bacterium]
MICPHCGTQWPEELASVLKFCGACGKSMSASQVSDVTIAQRGSDNTHPGGELRYMTVLFADLAGFTAFSEERSPDDVADVVGALLQRLGRVVEQYNGVVDKFLGDAVVATFGVPNPDPNAARNAVRAGQAMQQEAAQYNAESGFNFGLRVGIHAGEAMYREIGGAWTVMGDTVNTASRIQSVANQGSVWISQPVFDEVRRYFDTSTKPAIELRGKKHTVQPYEVLVERAIPLVELPPFVGRDAEWEILQSRLQKSLTENKLEILFIRGAAGVGKSRITWELREWAQHQPELFRFDLIQYDHSERLPSHGLNALIRNRFKLPLELSEDATLKRLTDHLRDEYPNVQKGREKTTAELLAFVLGIQRPDFHISSMDGPAKWGNAFAEIKAWIESMARQEPWIIILEDAQKGDADTAAFLEWANHVQWNAPIFILITVREEDFGPECYWFSPLKKWNQEGLIQEIRLKEIHPEILAQALIPLGNGLISPGMAARIAEHTEGNPLFATETALLIKEHGLAGVLPENMPLPGSIREVMEARLERLGIAGKEVAKRGALMGRRFTLEAVGRIWDRPMPEMTLGIDVLRETETIYQEVSKLFAGEMEEVFRHGRLQEAALARIPREERLKWLQGLEAWAKSKLEVFGDYWEGAGILLVPLIARSRIEHGDLTEASLWHEALGWLHKKYHRGQEAAGAFRDAFEASAGIRRLVLARQIAEIDVLNGNHERGQQILESTLKEARDATPGSLVMPARIRQLIDDPIARWDRIRAAEALLALNLTYADTLTRIGKVLDAENAYQQAELTLDGLNGVSADILRLRWANLFGYFMAEIIGKPQVAHQIYTTMRGQMDLGAEALQSERMSMLITEFNIEMRMGRYDHAKALADELLAVAQRNHNTRVEARAWNSMGITQQSLGDWNQATSCYENAIRLSRSLGERRLEAIATHNLGLILMDEGRYNEAAQCQHDYLALSRSIGNHMAESYAPAYLGLIELCQANFERAAAFIAHSLKLARENNWHRLVAVNQTFEAMLKLYTWLETRQPAKLAGALQAFKEAEPGWQGLDEAGEFYAAYAIASQIAEGPSAAREILQRAHQNVDESWVTARTSLEIAEAIAAGRPIEEKVDWFAERGFTRWVDFIKKITS